MAFYNPFERRESHGPYSLTVYRILIPLSWLLVVVTGFYYTIHAPHDVKNGHAIFKQANKHLTPFSLSTMITKIYWVILFLTQLCYVYHLFSRKTELVNAVVNIGGHFILNNLFTFAWILLWTRNHFWGSEIILIANYFNLHGVYWRHRAAPAFAHLGAIAGPYAWTFITIFWNGAVAVDSNSFGARIAANVFIWVIFFFGSTHVQATNDYLLGYCLSLLTLALAVKQIAIKVIALQWIFAFVIFAIFFLESIHLSVTKFYGRDSFFRRIAEPQPTDREREPLLNDEAGATV